MSIFERARARARGALFSGLLVTVVVSTVRCAVPEGCVRISDCDDGMTCAKGRCVPADALDASTTSPADGSTDGPASGRTDGAADGSPVDGASEGAPNDASTVDGSSEASDGRRDDGAMTPPAPQ